MDELIYRKELADEIQRIYDEHYLNANNQTVHDIFHAVLNRIYKAKTVDVELVQHGYWVKVNPQERKFMCSVCKKERRAHGQSLYCCDCGAKMDEVNV